MAIFSELDYDENIIVKELVESQFIKSSCDVIMGLLTFVTVIVLLQSTVLIAYFWFRSSKLNSYSVQGTRI